MKEESRIIVALDGKSEEESLALAETLRSYVWGFKVNDLHTECGVEIVRKLKKFGNVMVDLKLNDIRNTVKNHARRLVDAGADLLTLHASAGLDKLLDAVELGGDKAGVLAITVLTDLDEEECQAIFGASVKATVRRFARWAALAKCAGIVCSPNELEMLGERRELADLLRAAAGIRDPEKEIAGDDQKRVNTAEAAACAGADLLVIGRLVTQSTDPIDKVQEINGRVRAMLAAREC